MISIKTHAEGQMLRIERLRQGKELKEVANRICSISTLSKIERGKLIYRHENRDITLEKRIKAQRILQNSYSTLGLMWTYWTNGEYNMVNNLSKMAINFALDEGNTWALSQVYLLLGGIYACYNMEEAMIGEYQKSMNLLKSTNWTKELESMYYNIGATYISLGDYKKSREYLEKSNLDNFNSYHKWAVLEIQVDNEEEANKWICKMEQYIKTYIEKNDTRETGDKFKRFYYDEMMKILEVTKLQGNGNPEESSDYIPLLESLMNRFLEEGRYGFMNFHKESLKEAYIKKRRYKDALELEELFSKIKTKHMINT